MKEVGMRIDILGAESLGVRGLCCYIKADRGRLYEEMPPPLSWHEHYAAGTATTRGFR